MDFTETFHQEDNVALTEEEKKEAEQLQKDEQLRRSDPAAYSEMIAKRSRIISPVTPTLQTFQASNPAFDSPGQGFPYFNPAIHSTEQESHFFSLAAMTTGQRYPFLDCAAIPLLPRTSLNISARTSPGRPPPALLGIQSMPPESSTRCNSAPPSSANDPVREVNKQNATPKADGNEWATSIESQADQRSLSPILGANTAMTYRDTGSPEKQDDPATLNLEPQRDTTSVLDSVAASAVNHTVSSPVLGSNTSTRSPETSNASGAYNLRRKPSCSTPPSSTSEPVLDLSPFPRLVDLLSREAARMSKERPSSKS